MSLHVNMLKLRPSLRIIRPIWSSPKGLPIKAIIKWTSVWLCAVNYITLKILFLYIDILQWSHYSYINVVKKIKISKFLLWTLTILYIIIISIRLKTELKEDSLYDGHLVYRTWKTTFYVNTNAKDFCKVHYLSKISAKLGSFIAKVDYKWTISGISNRFMYGRVENCSMY
jgi:hypothetical protein